MAEHLFLALSTKGFGETYLGVQVARSLHAQGERCRFLAHPASATVLDATPFEYTTIPDHVGPLLELYVDALVSERATASVVLSDFLTTDLWLQHHGGDRDFLRKYDLPLVAIDTWMVDRTGTDVDIYWQRRRRFEDWTGKLDLTLQPAPIADPEPDSTVYAALPSPVATGGAVRDALRRRLGVRPDDKVVLFCTADWQQTTYACPHAQRLSGAVPRLIGAYLDGLGDDLHLVHVGPRPYGEPGMRRYHWLPPLEPDAFDQVLGGADLLLSANVSATTITRAIVSGVPALALVNSFELAEPGAAGALPFALDENVVSPWLAANCPVYPYFMWPVGYHEFLRPVLDDSAYMAALDVAELLDRAAVVEAVCGLLRDDGRRRAHRDRQQRYVDALTGLSNPADLIRAAVEG